MDGFADTPGEALETPDVRPSISDLSKKRDRSNSPERPSKRSNADPQSLLPPGEERVDLEEYYEEYINLRRLELFTNYSDYLAQDPGANPELETWVNMARDLTAQDLSDMQRYANVACLKLGLGAKHMRWLIQQYVEDRKDKFQNRIHSNIDKCRWPRVADQLYRDLKELTTVTPDRATAKQYGTVMIRMRNRYFDVISEMEPCHWIPNKYAVEMTKTRFGADLKKASKQGSANRSADLDMEFKAFGDAPYVSPVWPALTVSNALDHHHVTRKETHGH